MSWANYKHPFQVNPNNWFFRNWNTHHSYSRFGFYSWLNGSLFRGSFYFIGSISAGTSRIFIIAKMLKQIRPQPWPAIAWLALCTWLLVLPGSALPKNDWLGKLWLDKWIHLGLFAFMVFLWCWYLSSSTRHRTKLRMLFTLIALLCLMYGIGMEFVQKYFVVNRSFDGGDIAADAAGCLSGWWYSGRRYIKK